MADDSDGMESFEVNDFDLNAAMHPGRRKRFTKEQRIYGMWANREDSDDERAAFGSKKKASMSTPVSFVSGGVKGGSGDPTTDERPPQSSDDDEPIEIIGSRQRRDRSRLGGGGGATGVRRDQVFAGLRSMGPTDSAKFGDWEKHTKGIGRKLLSQMGFVHGKGLGREGQGIAEPVQTAKRPGRAALGAYGPEAKGPKMRGVAGGGGGDSGDESDVDTRPKRPVGQWKKTAASKRAKYKYRTVDEVIAEGGLLGQRLDASTTRHSTKVIDMTGREQKVYSGYDAFSAKAAAPVEEEAEVAERAFDVPELRHNLELLVDLTEEKIVRNDRELRLLKDQNVALLHDKEQLTEGLAAEDAQTERMRQCLTLIERVCELDQSAALTLDHCKDLFEQLHADFYEEYQLFDLGALASSLVLPLVPSSRRFGSSLEERRSLQISEQFAGWDVLSEPSRGVDALAEWRDILQRPSADWASAPSGPKGRMQPYDRLLWDCWMAPVRRAALRWSPRDDCESMLRLVEAWSPLLPRWILENLLEQIILPRLQAQIDCWDPLTDTVPLHGWLHPWLALMGDRLQPVYAPIRHKLARALTQWHPSDPSGKMILTPWMSVFDSGTMAAFLSQNVVPKLDECLGAFEVNPASQQLDVWRWLMDWHDVLSPAVLAQLLVRRFFPKWHEALYTWLTCAAPNYDEISRWYSGWKSLFSEELRDVAAVGDQFSMALEMMNRSLSGVPIAPPTSAARPPPPASAAVGRPAPPPTLPRGPASFKDLVEQRAAERGLTYIPAPGKFREGKQVFVFGQLHIYMDRNVIFMQEAPTRWVPVGLEQLLSFASAAR